MQVQIIGDCGESDPLLDRIVRQAGFVSLPPLSLERLERGEGLPIPESCRLIVIATDSSGSDFETLLRVLKMRMPNYPIVGIIGSRWANGSRIALEAGIHGCLPWDCVEGEFEGIIREMLDPRHSTVLSYTLSNQPEYVPLIMSQARVLLENWRFHESIEPDRISVALGEALENALYHGNLGLDSELRQGNGNRWREESLRRRSLPPYRERLLRFRGIASDQSIQFVIRDEGAGFDPHNQRDCTESRNLERCSGRGLLLMRMYMDKVEYNSSGNEVTLIKFRPEPR